LEIATLAAKVFFARVSTPRGFARAIFDVVAAGVSPDAEIAD
jgi:hypothetical protein